MKVAIQISPQSKSAYFQSYVDIAQKELLYSFGMLTCEYRRTGPLEYLFVDIEESRIPQLLQLSFAQGVYSIDGEL